MVLIVSSDVASDYAELWFHVLRTSTTYPRRGPYRIILSHFWVVDGCCLAFVLWHAVALRSFFDVLRCSWGVPGSGFTGSHALPTSRWSSLPVWGKPPWTVATDQCNPFWLIMFSPIQSKEVSRHQDVSSILRVCCGR